MWKEISYKEIEGIRLGNATDDVAKTGVTVVIFEGRAIGGVDISGGGPASREVSLLDPITAESSINALVLSGGSAFGLAASDGVVKYLEEKDMGYQTFFAKVPLVCQSCIYDLSYGSSKIRPDAKMGYQACVNSEKEDFCGGNKGAGVGASFVFKDLYDINTYYQQAELALKLGDQTPGAINKCFNYFWKHVSNICSESFNKLKLCHPSVQLLKEYDDEHGTKFLETLYYYLRNERRLTQTSKAMFLHRNTLFYRIERIQEIMNTDMDNPDEREYIMLSLQIIMNENNK